MDKDEKEVWVLTLQVKNVRRIQCQTCGVKIVREQDEHHTHNGIHCVDCVSKEFFKCRACDSWHKNNGKHQVQGMNICSSCTPALTDNCIDCFQEFFLADMIEQGAVKFCKPCFYKNTKKCDKCKNVFHKNQLCHYENTKCVCCDEVRDEGGDFCNTCAIKHYTPVKGVRLV
jgi:hypothetical protein